MQRLKNRRQFVRVRRQPLTGEVDELTGVCGLVTAGGTHDCSQYRFGDPVRQCPVDVVHRQFRDDVSGQGGGRCGTGSVRFTHRVDRGGVDGDVEGRKPGPEGVVVLELLVSPDRHEGREVVVVDEFVEEAVLGRDRVRLAHHRAAGHRDVVGMHQVAIDLVEWEVGEPPLVPLILPEDVIAVHRVPSVLITLA